MHQRNVALAGSSLLLGGFLGALLTFGAAGSTFAPAAWFWLACWILLASGLALLVYFCIDLYREHCRQRSEALVLSFDPSDGRCVELQQARRPKTALKQNVLSTATESTLYYWEPPVNPSKGSIRVIRLKVTNQRSQWLRNVVVELVEMRDSDDRAHPHTNVPLRWIHDDDPPFIVSTHGAQCGPGSDPHTYVDLLFKVVGREDFRVQFANDGLRGQDVKDGVYRILLATRARDEETGRRTPTGYQAFEIVVSRDGDVKLVAREPKELGFQL